MDLSHSLARLFGLTLIVLAGAWLINWKFFKKIWQDVVRHPVNVVFSGFTLFLLGLLVINFHTIWTPDWKGLVTFLGWLLTAGGLVRLVFPERFLELSQKLMKNKTWLQIVIGIAALVGFYLTYMGFYPPS